MFNPKNIMEQAFVKVVHIRGPLSSILLVNRGYRASSKELVGYN